MEDCGKIVEYYGSQEEEATTKQKRNKRTGG